ncbi:bifunctional ADP-dependent NAD(P)H-hydrate dehydratase/NAD(P)H-hydrate epimerase [Agrobacterium bohemicum]|uniref:Bifunctional NAD(P)H-hydrate repair enzyme n=1 Tax=Agrobacterium bohemicum TaxID=2052828 RepID=A0A135P882_9HYPH|nr:bifunctional ADP-dependent NAD(P)H-hydrate dehydratase/NAD(P)H-hydrate epimerase [Agrobacterium bohemicum]KXG87633.1 bifunctional ADP-dependent (S)-NAD(P)H-hydrate dehydratase/NAD(P)H-hydrate epimerase [Agrobacterium bohemicum]
MTFTTRHALIDPIAMNRIDTAAEKSGISIASLMERAGQAVAASALKHYPQAIRYVALCGIGKNGGDGFVAARALLESSADVAVYVFGDVAKLKGVAKQAFDALEISSEPLDHYRPQAGDVVIDAIFGAGLSRDVPDGVDAVIDRVETAGIPVIAIDLPSGLCGRRGVPLGRAFHSQVTVTFMARKPGHVLMPGRTLCGSVEVFDIGIPHRILREYCGLIVENHPAQWMDAFSKRDEDTHKFKRGHLTVFSGPSHATGAARMAAIAGFRAGAGIVTIAAPHEAIPVLSTTLTAVMVSAMDSEEQLLAWRDDKRHGTYVLGPGFGDVEKARGFVSLLKDKALVLDADGITAFRDRPQQLFDLFASDAPRILTPHEGEFGRLFPEIAADSNLSKVEKAQAAAALSNAVIVYKGADTVIAAPDGRAAVNANAPSYLATAGSGDVLAGIAGGFLAQHVPAFEAAAAAVWLHGKIARELGPGMTAEDLAAAVRPFQP